MQYRAPPMPIDLTNSHAVESAIESLSHSSQSTRDNGIDEEDQFQQFRLIAQSKHNIRMS